MGKSDVLNEFKQRKAVVEAQARDQQDEKRSRRAKRSREMQERTSRAVAQGSDELAQKLSEMEAWGQLETPEFGDYCAKHSASRFFTSADPVETFNALVEAIQKKSKEDGGEWAISEDKLKVKYSVNMKTEYEEEEEEEAKTPAEESVKVAVSATVCKVDEHLWCLDFVLKEGPRETFLEHFDQLRTGTVLADYNNATYEQ